jgi:hypothetical protein
MNKPSFIVLSLEERPLAPDALFWPFVPGVQMRRTSRSPAFF